MARPARSERSRSARPSRQLSRFYHSINPDRVFGTHRALFPWRSEIHSKKLERGGAGVLPVVKRVGLEDDDVVGLVFYLADCRAGLVNETKRAGAAYDIENVLLRSV